MNTTLRGVGTPAEPWHNNGAEDEGLEVKERQDEVRPAHWIPGPGPLPANFFLPGLA